MRNLRFTWYVVFLFVLLSGIFFREYIFTKRVPLPFNLLASFYAPWKYETWPGYVAGIPNKPMGNDSLKLFYPFKKFAIDELKAGRIPLWNPYFFSGSVFHATYQSALFYPLNVVYFLLPLRDAWSALTLIQPILAGWFTYLFLRSLKLSRASSIFGAIGFAFSGWMIAHWEEVLVIEHTILWMPLALYASVIVWDTTHKMKGFVLLVLALTCSILAGFPQAVVYLFGTVICWNIYMFVSHKQSDDRVQRLRVVVGSCLLSVIITALQWLPAFEAYLLAPRSVVDSSYLFKTFLTPWYYLITFIAPDFWGNPGTYNYFSNIVYLQERTIFLGIPMLIFTLYQLFRRTRGIVRFWKYFTLITLSLGFSLPTSWLWYVFHVPVLSVGMPVRIFILSTFGMCVLAAFGIERCTKEGNRVALKTPILFVGAVLTLLWVFVFLTVIVSIVYPSLAITCQNSSAHWCDALLDKEVRKQVFSYSSISLRNLILPTILFVTTVFLVRYVLQRRFVFILSMSAVTLIGSFHLANKLLYFSDRIFEYPPVTSIVKLKELSGYDRVWSYGDGYIVRNIPTYYQLFSPEGYEALYSLRYGSLLNTIMTRGIVTDRIHRTDATLSETGQYERMTYNPIRLRLMSLLGVKYILEHKDWDADTVLSTTQRFPPDLFSLAWENDQWRIWEYSKALPRVFIAHQTLQETDPQKIVDRILDPSTDLRETVILENDVEIPGINLTNSGNRLQETESITIVSYQPSTVEVAVDAKSDGLLFLSDTYYPGWKAFVDGSETPIYRANFVFRAVRVAEGMHKVKFVYDPMSFKIGALISGIGVAVFISLLVFI